jgi:hypothetical protein
MANKRTDRRTWLRHARAWKQSGLTCEEYAEREGLTASTLSWWAWKLRASGEAVPGGREARARRRKPARTRPRRKLPFVEVAASVEPVPAATAKLELEAAGVVVRVGAAFDDAQLCRVLDVLEARR